MRGYENYYYDLVINFMRLFFSNSLCQNEYMEFTFITGVLNVNKDSLFNDTSIVRYHGINDSDYNEYFGFTESETKQILNYYDLELTDEVKKMYGGYNFGGTKIYNINSIVHYISNNKFNYYWLHEKNNPLILKLIRNCNDSIKLVLENLILGDKVEFEYQKYLSYLNHDNYKSLNNFLNILLACGYLSIDKNCVKVPNREVAIIFSHIILNIYQYDYKICISNIYNFYNGISTNNLQLIEKSFKYILDDMFRYKISYKNIFSYPLGVIFYFLNNDYFIVKINRKIGEYYCDIMIKNVKFNEGIIISLIYNNIDIKDKFYVDFFNNCKVINKYNIYFDDFNNCSVKKYTINFN